MVYYTAMVALGNATTNPDPNTLATKNPTYDELKQTVSSAWNTQGSKLLVGIATSNLDNSLMVPTHVVFVPSGGGAVTYTVTLWNYIQEIDRWIKNNNLDFTWNLTGNQGLYLPLLKDVPAFLQLSSISAGTVAINADTSRARVL